MEVLKMSKEVNAMKHFLPAFLSLALLLSGCMGNAVSLETDKPPDDGASSTELAAEEGSAAAETIPNPSSDNPESETKPESNPEPEPQPEEPYVRVIDPSRPMVALTFDDGPHETYTGELLDILEEHHAVATFFEVGANVAQYPDELPRMAELGCEIGSHSNTHKDLKRLKKATLLDDLQTADEAFVAAGVDVPAMLRPPYGSVNKTVLQETGRTLVTWSIDTEDWKSRDARTVADYIETYGDLDGEVILLHSIYESTVEAMREVVPWLIEQGYQLVTMTELLAYYYGELPEVNRLYGYTYFARHERTDTPLSLPVPEPVPAEVPAEEPAAADSEAVTGYVDLNAVPQGA